MGSHGRLVLAAGDEHEPERQAGFHVCEAQQQSTSPVFVAAVTGLRRETDAASDEPLLFIGPCGLVLACSGNVGAVEHEVAADVRALIPRADV